MSKRCQIEHADKIRALIKRKQEDTNKVVEELRQVSLPSLEGSRALASMIDNIRQKGTEEVHDLERQLKQLLESKAKRLKLRDDVPDRRKSGCRLGSEDKACISLLSSDEDDIENKHDRSSMSSVAGRGRSAPRSRVDGNKAATVPESPFRQAGCHKTCSSDDDSDDYTKPSATPLLTTRGKGTDDEIASSPIVEQVEGTDDFFESDDDEAFDYEDNDAISNESIKRAKSRIKPIEIKGLSMAIQGFRGKGKGRNSTNEQDRRCKRDGVQSSELLYDPATVVYKGKTFEKGECYYITKASNKTVSVGIIKFEESDQALVILVVPFEDTILGMSHEGVSFESNSFLPPSTYVQVDGESQVLSLGELQEPNHDIGAIPTMAYEPQQHDKGIDFAYYSSNVAPTIGCYSSNELGVVELFAGAGGMHLGFQRSGFRTIMAVENDPSAVQTLTSNNADGRLPVFPGDVEAFLEQQERDKLEMHPMQMLGPVQHVHASSPCQGFSGANRNGGKHDKKNNDLSLTFPRAVDCFKPRTASFENVVGMWRRKHLHYLLEIMARLLKLKYQVRLCMLKACNYGDPQKRPRLFILAADEHTRLPDVPPRTHGDGTKQQHVNAKDALDSLLRYRGRGPLFNDTGRKTTTANAAAATDDDNSGKDEAEAVVVRRRIPIHGPAATVLATSMPPWHYEEDRCITVREAAFLQSFPINYKFYGKTLSDQYKQVGNAVPVQLATAVARSIQQVHGYN